MSGRGHVFGPGGGREGPSKDPAAPRAGGAAVALLLAVASLACGPGDAEAGPRSAAAADVPPSPGSQAAATSWAPPPVDTVQDRDRLGREIDESRATAIVRAAGKAAPAVVTVNVIRTERARPRTVWESFMMPPGASRRTSGLGSGFVIDPGGLVLTNDHVVRGAERILVTLPDGRDLGAELVGTDQLTDVAVLRVDAGGERLPAVEIGSSRNLLIGEWVVAIGNPFGTAISNPEPTVTAGVVSAVGRHIVPSEGDRGFYLGMIQTDASINPGNSGGPLVNALGQVIGVNSSIFSRSGGSEGLGFAIPIDRALRVADDLVEFGDVRRAWVGIEVDAVEADAWGRTRGVRVSRVAPESPAAGAGIPAGVRILEANGTRLVNPLDFEAVLLDLRAGERVELSLEGSRSPVTLTARALPSVGARRVTVLEQIQVITVTGAIAAERGLASDRGALIVGIGADLAASVGLREGDVLLQINNTAIERAEDVEAALRGVPDRGRVRIYFERNGGYGIRDLVLRR